MDALGANVRNRFRRALPRQLEEGSRADNNSENNQQEDLSHLRREYEFSEGDNPAVEEEWVLLPKGGNRYKGKFHRLVVQETAIRGKRERATWQRQKLRYASPRWMQLADWPWVEDHEEEDEAPRTRVERIKRYIIASTKLSIEPWRTRRYYRSYPLSDSDRFPRLLYEFNGYSAYPVNTLEKKGHQYFDCKNDAEAVQNEQHHRCIGPSILKLLNDPESMEMTGCKYTFPKDTDSREQLPRYLFLSWYTGHFLKPDQPELEKIGERVARNRRLDAFWSSSCCLSADAQQGPVQFASQVNKMSDIVRSAEAIIIVLPAKAGDSEAEFNKALVEWGSRVWTLPEILLSRKDEIDVYIGRENMFENEPYSEPIKTFNKYELAKIAWPTDAPVVRQLLDHFYGNLLLSRLELSSLALRCLRHRKQGYAFPGDLTYALMGLHRLRPRINIEDTAFMAFARLSRAGDSDKLMERAVCMQTPENDRDSWLSLKDDFQSQLWDIQPEVQIAAICDKDTVILDGAFGTPIIWNAFPMENTYNLYAALLYLQLKSTLPSFVIGLMFFFIGVGIYAKGQTQQSKVTAFASLAFDTDNSTYYQFYDHDTTSSGVQLTTKKALLALGVIITTLSLLVAYCFPYFIHRRLKRFAPNPKPCLLAFEGYMPLKSLERRVFGRNYNLLKWDPYGSTLSMHSEYIINKNATQQFLECRGDNPKTDKNLEEIIDAADSSPSGALKVFTLINMHTLKVTLFQARTPPAAALICGSEGGMKRVVLCSYNWSTNALYKEAVIRMETPIVDFMYRVSRFRFGFRRLSPQERIEEAKKDLADRIQRLRIKMETSQREIERLQRVEQQEGDSLKAQGLTEWQILAYRKYKAELAKKMEALKANATGGLQVQPTGSSSFMATRN